MAVLRTKNGVVVTKPDGSALAESCDCCGGGGGCPSDCSACTTPTQAVITGACSDHNGTWALTRTGCVWASAGGEVTVACISNQWRVQLLDTGPPNFCAADDVGIGVASACPPLGTFALTTGQVVLS